MGEDAQKQRLEQLVDAVFMGVNLSRATSMAPTATSVSVIHVKDIDNGFVLGRLDLESVRIDREKVGRQELQVGDILVSARGTLLKCSVIRDEHKGCVASANFIVIRPGANPPLASDLLCAFLRQTETQAFLLGRVSGTAQPALTIRDIESLSLAIPPREEQEILVRLIHVADELYRTMILNAALRREEALAIVAAHMRNPDAHG